ncbi:MAG: radical SAM protein [Anaerolineales bacterium]|nr:MAG: radical SAM protein [Anaerolineales bacterium]
MNAFNSLIKKIQVRVGYNDRLPQPGLYHYDRQDNGERSRIHLRVDPDGTGLLIVNASRIMHLNPTAASMAYLILEDTPQQAATRSLAHLYHARKETIVNDYAQTAEKLHELIRPDGACPIHELDLEVTAPFSTRPSAPYRMDLAITYRCNNDCSHCYNARPRDYPELSTRTWHQVLDKLWAIGIPHVVFTGGEPTLRKDLPELIAHAEQNGQITGINTNGRRLSDRNYVDRLVEAGLDHVQITLESHSAEVHDSMVHSPGAWKQTVAGIRNVLESPLYVMTNTTMLTTNSPTLSQTLEFLAELGVPTVGLNALIYSGRGRTVDSGLAENKLHSLLELARESTNIHQQRLIWYTPTQYCHFDPMQFELGVKGCTAALYNMCVEPDGSVIPCQSYYQSLGNILSNEWKDIWNHKLSIRLRERQDIPEKCVPCSLLSECGGGCPLAIISGEANSVLGGENDQHN